MTKDTNLNEDSIVAESLLSEYRVPGADVSTAGFFQQLQPYVQDELRDKFQSEPIGRIGQHVYLNIQGYRIETELVMVRPPLAQKIGRGTLIEAVYVAPMPEEASRQSFIAAVIDYPSEEHGIWYDSLVGIDDIKKDLLEKMRLLLSKDSVKEWSIQTFGKVIPACAALLGRYPFFILEGDVGSGKTALARSIGHPLAQSIDRPVQLLVMNTQVRGTGLVGELTHNISLAFSEAEERSRRLGIPILLLIDEADALAQARGHTQMHHEDEAGVNTLIQRIDLLRDPGKQVIVLFATNMGMALDSAIQRRAAASYHFQRPNDEVRRRLFETFLEGSNIASDEIGQLVQATAPRAIPGFGDTLHPFTHSDIVQRIIPSAMEEAYLKRDSIVRLFDLLLSECNKASATPKLEQSQ